MPKYREVELMSTSAPTTAMAVANWFLEKSWEEPSQPPCDPMKLNKLVFYAHGWYLGNQKGELFPEDVEAWPHGPVVRNIYIAFKEFGRDSISTLGKGLELGADGSPSFVTSKHDGTLNSFFEEIWNVYGDKTGIQLSNMTHREGEPWTIVAKTYKYDLTEKPTIPSEIIEVAFARKIRA